MNTSLWINGNITGMSKYNTAGADGRKCFSVLNNTGSYCGIVSGTSDYNCRSGKSCLFRDFRKNGTGYLRGLINLCKEALINIKLLQNLVRPLTFWHVQKLHTGSVRYLCCKLTGQDVTDIIFREEDVLTLCIIFRLMVADPEDLRSSKTGQGWVCSDFDQTLCSNLLGDLPAFFPGTLVAPDNGWTDHLACLVQHNKTVHLAGDT